MTNKDCNFPEPEWVSKRVALAIHDRQIAEHGGIHGIRDEALLDSALFKPKNHFFYSKNTIDLADLAASYGYGLIKNHPFLDGNKRTSLIISQLFLAVNEHTICCSQHLKYHAIIQLAEGKLSQDEFSAFIRKYISKK